MLIAKVMIAKTQPVVSLLVSTETPATNAKSAHPNENKIENKYLNMLLAKNKTANRNIEAIPTNKAVAVCSL